MVTDILVVGVPWSIHEMDTAVQDACSLGAQLAVIDTTDALRLVPPHVKCELIAVPRLDMPHIVNALRGRSFAGIVSITELTMEVAAQVREALGFDGTTSTAERGVRDKPTTRSILKRSGLTQVDFWRVPLTNLYDFLSTHQLPLIVKPSSFTGSTGVRLVRHPDETDAVLSLYDADAARLHGRSDVIVETVINGHEISAEGLVVNGELRLITLTDKFNTGDPDFYEVAHMMPSRFSAFWRDPVESYLRDVVKALNICTSPIHAELKIDGDRIELIEIHSRFGGGKIVTLIQEAFRMRPYEAYFSAILGRDFDVATTPDCTVGVGFFVGRTNLAFQWPSFHFPEPSAVVQVDVDSRRRPQVVEYEGMKIDYWRAGHVLFAARDPEKVLRNVTFMQDRAREAVR